MNDIFGHFSIAFHSHVGQFLGIQFEVKPLAHAGGDDSKIDLVRVGEFVAPSDKSPAMSSPPISRVHNEPFENRMSYKIPIARISENQQ